jgi:hypothetical protein
VNFKAKGRFDTSDLTVWGIIQEFTL